MPQRVSLHDRSYQSWLLQLQTWAADGRLVSAGVDALRLKLGQATDQLNRIANRLSRVNAWNVSPMEVPQESAMRGAAKEVVLIP